MNVQHPNCPVLGTDVAFPLTTGTRLILSATNLSAPPQRPIYPVPRHAGTNNNLNCHHPSRAPGHLITPRAYKLSPPRHQPRPVNLLLSSTHNHHHYPNSKHALDRTKICPHKMCLPLLLLASAWGAALAADPCTVIITARTGDTCATISNLAGITVSQFLRANPSVSSCAALVAGTRYCVDPGFNAAPSSSSTSARPAATSGGGGGGSGAGLEVSTNGQCGSTLTCLTSPYGDCCSEHGWCGGTADHCSPPGCQAAYGRCDSPPSNGTATTVFITRMTTVISTVPGTGVGAGVTQIVRSTTTVTVPGQTTATVRVTDRSLVLLTSTVTTIKTVTITDARLCRTTTRAGAGAGGVVTRVEGGQGQGGEGAVLVPRGDGEGGEGCKFCCGGGGEGGC